MKADSALESILKDLTIALSEDNKLRNVAFTNDNSKYGDAPKEDLIRINPNHAEMLGVEDEITDMQEFSLLVSTESHELEHQVVSELNSIHEFVKQYPERPRMAGHVMNAVEDTYVDKRRTDRDRGLRPVSAMFAEFWIESQSPITEIQGSQKYVSAVFQITRGNGTPKGFENVADEDFRNYCAEVRAIIEKVKDTYIQEERVELGHEIMTLIENEIGKAEAPNELELPSAMKPANGEESPEANEDNVQDNIQEDMNSGEGENKNNEDPECPMCGCEHPKEDTQFVDAMTAARCTPPFNPDSVWIGEVEFISHDADDGLCGFRVKPTKDVPKEKIESQGYKVDFVSNTVEILEPKSRYDDDTPIPQYNCPKCNHEWSPMIKSE